MDTVASIVCHAFLGSNLRILKTTLIDIVAQPGSTKAMEIFFSRYTLHPVKRLNRTSSMDPKPGVFLKAVVGDKISFADYFPYAPYGDKSCESFLAEFKLQKTTHERKVLHFLKHDFEFQKIPQVRFKNHQLWSGVEDLASPLLKYRLMTVNDRTFMDPLLRGLRIRLDAKGLFDRVSFNQFMNEIPEEFRGNIEYIEDPLKDLDWSDLEVPVAADFFEGLPHQYHIHRPSCEFYPQTNAKVIFTSNLGTDLSRWHTYCELVTKGNLEHIHGIFAVGYYPDERHFYEGNYQDGFVPNQDKVVAMYQDLHKKHWLHLCSL